MENEEEALKEMYVPYNSSRYFEIPKAIVNHYSIEGGDGLICVLKEISDHRRERVKKIEKEILVDIDDAEPTEASFPEGVYKKYLSEYSPGYALLLIKKVIHE